MEIPGKKIARVLAMIEKKAVRDLKKRRQKPKLVVFLVGDSPDQISFVRIKRKLAKKLGIAFELIHLKETPSFESFIHLLKEKAADIKTSGIIIQQPLPTQLTTNCIFDFVPLEKEIEGHRRKTTFIPPLGQAVMTILKFIYSGNKINGNLLLNLKSDRSFLKRTLRAKKVVLIGRGLTGGQPIGKTLTDFGINYISINSETPEPAEYLRQADIIISAVGRKVLEPDVIKPGAILINAGLRKENGRLKGDYDEKEVKNIAGFYTPTPGGIGPIDVLYLYHNLIQAVKLQK
jgi:methylenetetrahydrofolate dehydrogenase (NADP+) / methenyltetrahydrofolate cyclohydrolase